MEQNNKKAISLVEMIIVITVVLILAAAAVSQTAGIQRLLQFNNAFQKTIFMIQRARTMALSSGTGSTSVAIQNSKIILDVNNVEKETYTLPSLIGLNPTQETAGVDCNNAKISFENGTGKTKLFCGDEYTGRFLTIKLCQVQQGTNASPICPQANVREKSFIIHKAVGTPQL